MITTFHQKRIRGVLGVLPENEYDYDEETKPFQDIHTKRLKRIMGYGKRRAAKSKTTTSDLCVYGFDYVLKHNWIKERGNRCSSSRNDFSGPLCTTCQ